MNTMRPGLPTGLRYIALLGTDIGRSGSEAHFVETCLPPSVRLVNIDDRFYTVKRSKTTDAKGGKQGGQGGGHGHVEGVEEWPERRVRLHAEEWLEAMGCEDAIWDDFAPGCFAV